MSHLFHKCTKFYLKLQKIMVGNSHIIHPSNFAVRAKEQLADKVRSHHLSSEI